MFGLGSLHNKVHDFKPYLRMFCGCWWLSWAQDFLGLSRWWTLWARVLRTLLHWRWSTTSGSMHSYTWVWGNRWRGLWGRCLYAAWWTYSPATKIEGHLGSSQTFLWICKTFDLEHHFPQTSHSRFCNTYSYFTQVNPIIERVPGTLLVVGPPGLFKDLVDALAFLAFRPVATWNTRRSRDAVGTRVTLSARGACWTLHATAKLGKQGKRKSW